MEHDVIDEATYIGSPRRGGRTTAYIVRWAAVTTTALAFVVGTTVGMAIQFAIDHPAEPPVPTYELNGEDVPYVDGDDYVVLICPEGLSIGIDTTPEGIEWAGCM